MPTLPVWTTDPDSLTFIKEQHGALPDQVRKLIEVIDGHVIFCQSRTPEQVTRDGACLLERSPPPSMCIGHRCLWSHRTFCSPIYSSRLCSPRSASHRVL